MSVGSDRKCATVDQLPGGDGRGGSGRIGHRVVAGPGGSQGEVRQGFHLEAVVGTAGEKPRGGNGRGRKIFREEKDDGERLLHHPIAVNEKASRNKKEETREEDDLIADAGGHGVGMESVQFSVFSDAVKTERWSGPRSNGGRELDWFRGMVPRGCRFDS